MQRASGEAHEEADSVARTKNRINEALARNSEEHDERARKIAKQGHHEASSDKGQASSSSSSGVIRSREEQQRDNQDDVKMNEDDRGQMMSRIDSEMNKAEKMS